MTPEYVADSSVLFDLAHGGLLEPFFALPWRVCCPDLLAHELRRPSERELAALGLVICPLNEGQVEAVIALRLSTPRLAVGDLAAFVLAHDSGTTLLTGDGPLRAFATERSVLVHGTLWVLDSMIELEQITARVASNRLRAMLNAGRRLPALECKARLARWR